ncbi:hypothetical protein KVC38_07495 [Helicobacter pylori]|uniref:hypothetical protein n=1 Tax=Helicobacter pylori TaxID=210 RepID=UPI003087E85F|nr:hypothetical protein KVC38_07495 [Helicobacter pylori]
MGVLLRYFKGILHYNGSELAYRSSLKHALKWIAFFDEKRADFGMLFACYEFARV